MKSVKEKEQIKKAWKNFLKLRDWTVWLTIRPRIPVKDIRAKMMFKRFLKRLNHPGEEYFNRFVEAFVFYEKNHPESGHVHTHAVLNRIDPKHCSAIEKKCMRLFGQSKVKPLHDGVPDYLADKQVYSKLVSFDFYKINSRYRGKGKIL